MFRKFLFSMVAVFVRSPYLQGYVGVFIVVGATIFLCIYKPYSESKVFKLELCMLLVAGVTLLAPQMGRTLQLDSNLGTRMQQGTLENIDFFITWFLLVLNFSVLLVFAAYYSSIVRDEIKFHGVKVLPTTTRAGGQSLGSGEGEKVEEVGLGQGRSRGRRVGAAEDHVHGFTVANSTYTEQLEGCSEPPKSEPQKIMEDQSDLQE